MKEHAGGTPDIGFISFDKWEEDSFPVPVQQFDFRELDRPEDYIVEKVKNGVNIGPFLKAFVERAANTATAFKIAALISILLESKHPRMVAHQIVWATGMTLLDGASIIEMAAKYGVSKEAFQQGALRICKKLNLRPCRNMRDEKARKCMSKSNYRRKKHELSTD